jgi:hypothetical protein
LIDCNARPRDQIKFGADMKDGYTGNTDKLRLFVTPVWRLARVMPSWKLRLATKVGTDHSTTLQEP